MASGDGISTGQSSLTHFRTVLWLASGPTGGVTGCWGSSLDSRTQRMPRQGEWVRMFEPHEHRVSSVSSIHSHIFEISFSTRFHPPDASLPSSCHPFSFFVFSISSSLSLLPSFHSYPHPLLLSSLLIVDRPLSVSSLTDEETFLIPCDRAHNPAPFVIPTKKCRVGVSMVMAIYPCSSSPCIRGDVFSLTECFL